jgi:hypothetical protein
MVAHSGLAVISGSTVATSSSSIASTQGSRALRRQRSMKRCCMIVISQTRMFEPGWKLP